MVTKESVGLLLMVVSLEFKDIDTDMARIDKSRKNLMREDYEMSAVEVKLGGFTLPAEPATFSEKSYRWTCG